MTPAFVPENFEQIMGCTVADLLRALPLALPGAEADTAAALIRCVFPDGELRLAWHALPARRISLLEIPRLQVRFEYSGLSAESRHEVQRRFDLATQRGGG